MLLFLGIFWKIGINIILVSSSYSILNKEVFFLFICRKRKIISKVLDIERLDCRKGERWKGGGGGGIKILDKENVEFFK